MLRRRRVLLPALAALVLACGGVTTPTRPPLHGSDGGVITFAGQGPHADAARLEARLSALGCTSTGVRDWQGDIEVSVESCADLAWAGSLAVQPGRLVLVTEAGERVALSSPSQVDVVEDPVMGTTIEVKLREADGVRFGELTAAHVDEVLTVQLDDQTLMAPVVREAIKGGKLQITLGDSPLDPVWPVLLMYPGPEGLWTVASVAVDPSR